MNGVNLLTLEKSGVSTSLWGSGMECRLRTLMGTAGWISLPVGWEEPQNTNVSGKRICKFFMEIWMGMERWRFVNAIGTSRVKFARWIDSIGFLKGCPPC